MRGGRKAVMIQVCGDIKEEEEIGGKREFFVNRERARYEE